MQEYTEQILQQSMATENG